MKQKLGLHSHVLPALQNDHKTLFEEAKRATVFDCRSINSGFLKDTGRAALDEWRALNRQVRLPFDACWFEFDREFGILAADVFWHHDLTLDGDRVVEQHPFLGWGMWDELGYTIRENYSPFGEFRNGARFPDDPEVVPYTSRCNASNAAEEAIVDIGMELLVGVLALMQDRLVGTEFRPDENARLNKDRAKRGKLPISSDTHVLSLNMGAVRRVARPADGTHESPRLHWRRGHWRLLHRGSEFENQTWVKRCLVGDPDRGFVHKDYRLTWRPPMIAPSSDLLH